MRGEYGVCLYSHSLDGAKSDCHRLLSICQVHLIYIPCARNLGIYLDGDVSMLTHCSGTFCHATSDTKRSPFFATSSLVGYTPVA